MQTGSQLRDLIATDSLVVCPGVHDPLTARAADLADFDAIYMTGYGTSLSQTGYPDVGLVTMPEMLENANAVQERVDVPVFCDADTGYGDVKNLIRTVREYIKTGVAGVHIEDQETPKRGAVGDFRVIPEEDAITKIEAACDVRDEREEDFVIIARSDSPGAVNGSLQDGIDRLNAYCDAGADVAFITGQETDADVEQVGREVDAPLVYDWNGDHPRVGLDQLEEWGYDLVIFPLLGTQAAMLETYRTAERLREEGASAVGDLVDEFDDLPHSFTDFAGYPEIAEWEDAYHSED